MRKTLSAVLFMLFAVFCSAQDNPIYRKPIDLPIPVVPLVEYYQEQFLTSWGKRRLGQIMGRSSPYRGYIRQKIEEYDLPQCLEFLPVVESDFKTYAISRSGAMGIWQFMLNSISEFDIRSNEWIDERRDPWLSTDAALKKLRENYEYFNDWYLALAAYNAGLNGIRRALNTHNAVDYWDLSNKGGIRTETEHYVPKFLAIADLLTNASYYGIKIPPFDPDAYKEFSTFETNFAIDIELLANAIGIDPDLLRFYNPALNTNLTPPNMPYILRFPKENEEAVLAYLKNNPPIISQYE